MVFKLFFTLFLLFGVLNAEEYPQTFARLGTPLFESSKKLSAFSEIDSLTPEIQKYQTKVILATQNGYKADTKQNKKEIKEYLSQLRKLQKNYDFLLYLIRQEIVKSIDKKEYDKFIKLTSFELDGLLENKNFKNKSIEFYKKNRHLKKIELLEKKINNEALLEATTQEFYNEIVESTYSSNDKKSNSKKSVSIYTTRVKNQIKVNFLNTNPYDVTVGVRANYTNLIESPNTPNEFVIKAKSSFYFTTLTMSKAETAYSFSYGWIIGNKDAIHDDEYLYRLPYSVGEAHRISQGYNGKYTHKGSSQFALDFVMNQGTKVCAAREGVVVRTKSDSNSGGYDKKFAKDGNYVTIEHSDGTFATYYHLKQYGVMVKIGEKVQRGTPIGYSGNTGYTSGPHLHFAIFKAVSAKATHSIAVKFIDANGIVEVPTQGSAYVAK